jgi:hypothetical protein
MFLCLFGLPSLGYQETLPLNTPSSVSTGPVLAKDFASHLVLHQNSRRTSTVGTGSLSGYVFDTTEGEVWVQAEASQAIESWKNQVSKQKLSSLEKKARQADLEQIVNTLPNWP